MNIRDLKLGQEVLYTPQPWDDAPLVVRVVSTQYMGDKGLSVKAVCTTKCDCEWVLNEVESSWIIDGEKQNDGQI